MAKLPVQSVLDVIADGGNEFIKGYILGRVKTMCVFPHALKYLTERTFSQSTARYDKGRKSLGEDDYNIFEYRLRESGRWVSKYVSVGHIAEQSGGVVSRASGEKYTRDYYGVLLAKLLYSVVGDSHDNIRLTIGYPSGDLAYADNLINSVMGSHQIKFLDGTKKTFIVREVFLYEEGEAGACNFFLTKDGVHYRPQVADYKGMILDINIGGKVSSITPVKPATAFVDYQGVDSIGRGVADILTEVGRGIYDMRPELFTGSRESGVPSDHRLRDALITGEYRQMGYVLDVRDLVEESVSVFMTDMNKMIVKKVDLGQFECVTISGGGGYPYYHALADYPLGFNPDLIFPAVDQDDTRKSLEELMRTQMHLSVVLGAGKMTQARLYQMTSKKRVKRRR